MVHEDNALHRALQGCAAVTLLCGLLPALGWLLTIPGLTRFWLGPASVHTTPWSATVLLVLGAGLFHAARAGRDARSAWGSAGLAGLVALGGTLLSFTQRVGPKALAAELLTMPLPSPPNGFGLACASAAMFAAARGGRYGVVVATATMAALIAVFAGMQLTFSAIASPGNWFHETPLPTALGMFATAAGALALRPDEGVAHALRDRGAVGVLARRLALSSLVVPTMLGTLRALSHERGLFSVQFGISLFATSMCGIMLGISVWIVRAVERAEAARREVATALHRSESAFRETFAQNALGMARVHPEGRFLDVNAALCELVGYDRDALLARRFQDITHPDDLDGDLELVRDVLAGRRARYTLEKRYLHRDGRVVSVLLGVSLVRSLEGAPDFFVASIQDVSALRDARDALHRVGEMRRAILDAANLSIISTDPQGVVRTFNHGAERLLGYRAEEVIGRHTPSLFHDADEVRAEADALTRRLGRAVPPGFETFVAEARQGGLAEREWTYMGAGGARTPVFLSVTALRDARGEIDGFLGIAADITERRRYVREIEASLREKELLLQEVHHRVKNNLQVVTSLLRLSARAVSSPEAREVFAQCQSRIAVMARVHEQLYQLGHFGTVDFAAHLRAVVALSRDTHAREGLSVRVQVQADPLWLGLDEAIPLGLIAHELISNAFKHAFGTRGEGRLEISLQQHGAQVVLRVLDDGPGVAAPKNDVEKGLGLRLVRTLCSQLHAVCNTSNYGGNSVEISFQHVSEGVPHAGTTRLESSS